MNTNLLSVLFYFLFISFNLQADLIKNSFNPKSIEDDALEIEESLKSCKWFDLLVVNRQFPVGCYSNYQHYGPSSKFLTPNKGVVKIAGYNLLHPGTSKALFKDYNLIAKIMNKFDVISAVEILSVVGHDRVNNQAVLGYLNETADLASARKLFRAPGYLKILIALKKLDPSWALILSPRGDSAVLGSVEEMIGFFYRANIVSPIVNPHCDEFKDQKAGVAYACLINLTNDFMDKNYLDHFSRRPFLASFKSDHFRFSLVGSHVVFNYSGDDERKLKLMNDVFGVSSPSELGGGINNYNFARFGEVKITLDFMNRYRQKYQDLKIMMISDTNLPANNVYWPHVLNSFPGGSLLINAHTTISPVRFLADGRETFGVANSYDHFIFDKNVFSSCDQGSVYNYYQSEISSDIENLYMVRSPDRRLLDKMNFDKSFFIEMIDDVFDMFSETEITIGGDVPPDEIPFPVKLDYEITAEGQKRMDYLVSAYDQYLSKILTIKNNKIVPDDFQLVERVEGFKRRVFMNQLTNAFYYKFYQEILSDHFPVSINCSKD